MQHSNVTTAESTVRKATTQDVEPVRHTLAAAFFEDPVMSWVYPDPDERLPLLQGFFGAILRATFPHGGIETVSDERAAAIWVPPDAELDDESMAEELVAVSGPHAGRVLTLFETVDVKHPQHTPHHYLVVLGTRPEWQSRGLGSALVRSVLEPADTDRVPAYLEASSERNKQLYLRHGFEVQETVTLPDGGPPVWCMWRDPSS